MKVWAGEQFWGITDKFPIYYPGKSEWYLALKF